MVGRNNLERRHRHSHLKGATEPILTPDTAPAHPSPPSLIVAIQALHQAIADHADPAAKQTLAACLQNMLKVQQTDMQQQQKQSPIAAALAQQGGPR